MGHCLAMVGFGLAVALAACETRHLVPADGAAPADAQAHDAQAHDATAETPAQDRGQGETPPTSEGRIACGDAFCDPTVAFCAHYVDGLAPNTRVCQPLPASCAGQGGDCGCLPDGSAPFCYACRQVTGTSVTGLELDCPGPVD
jgi:hypothetical protein